jgi:hypothetical protein
MEQLLFLGHLSSDKEIEFLLYLYIISISLAAKQMSNKMMDIKSF